MEIREDVRGVATVLSPVGGLDASTSAAFQARLLGALGNAGAAHVVVDMAEVDFISSAGLRAMMIGAKQARARGGRLGVAALTETVREIFEISKFHLVVPVFATVSDAVASLSPPADGPGGGRPRED